MDKRFFTNTAGGRLADAPLCRPAPPPADRRVREPDFTRAGGASLTIRALTGR